MSAADLARPTGPSAPPIPALPTLAPLGEAFQQLFKMPQQLIAEAQPGLQQQIKDFPEIVRLNMQHIMRQAQEIPSALAKQTGDLTKSGFPVKTAAQVLSPIPLLSAEDLQKIQQAKAATEPKA